MRYNTVPDIQSIPSKYQLLLLSQFKWLIFLLLVFLLCNFSSPQLLEESPDAGFCAISSCLRPQSFTVLLPLGEARLLIWQTEALTVFPSHHPDFWFTPSQLRELKAQAAGFQGHHIGLTHLLPSLTPGGQVQPSP